MKCSQFDVKALSLGELGGAEKTAAENHLETCAPCREEYERLAATRAALFSLQDEEMPRRIAFVSDRVFEPRWWQRLLRSGPALGFASAAMLSVAILVHAFARPAPAPVAVTPPVQTVDTVAVEARIGAEVEKRVQAVVDKAVTQSEQRQSERFRKAMTEANRGFELQLASDRVAYGEQLMALRKKLNVAYVLANAEPGGRP